VTPEIEEPSQELATEPKEPTALWRIMFAAGLAAVLLGFAGWMLVKGLGERNLAEDSKGWPTAPSVVTASDTERDTVNRRRGGRETRYRVRVEYDYVVDGASYHGDRIRAACCSYEDWSKADQKARQYRVRSTVQVRYDPDNPGRAVLEPGGAGWWWVVAGLGAVMGAVGLFLAGLVAQTWWQRRQTLRLQDEPVG
jgi:hypothetical protein